MKTFLAFWKSKKLKAKSRNPFLLSQFLLSSFPLMLALQAGFAAAQTPVDEEAPWPRVRSANGNTVTLNLPQVETWTSNSFRARAVVGVKPTGAKKESLGVIWFEAHGSVDRSNRVVTLDRMEITKGRFPETADNGSTDATIHGLSPRPEAARRGHRADRR